MMQKVYPITSLLILVMTVSSCGEPLARQEIIERPRSIGVVATPLVNAPSTATEARRTELSVVVALPNKEQEATIEPFEDEAVFGAYMIPTADITILEDQTQIEDYPGIRLVTFKADITIPSQEQLQGLSPVFRGVQMRYGFRVTTDDFSEVVVGSFLVYPEQAPELAWVNPDASITNPVASTTLAKDAGIDIVALVSSPNDEEQKIGWFVTGGKIINRRAAATKWTPTEAGEHSLIVTVRGKQSRSFSMQVINVTVE